MTNTERLVPHILDLVDVTRWERQARLVAIVAARTWGGDSLTKLGVPQLMALGDDEERAKWDLELLHRLAKRDRVLSEMTARGHPPAFCIAAQRPESILRWRHVPWSVPRSELLKHLLGAWEAVPVAWLTALAAQSPHLQGVESPGDATVLGPTRGNGPFAPRATPQGPRATPRPPGGTPTPTESQATAGDGDGDGDTSSSLPVKDLRVVGQSLRTDGRTETDRTQGAGLVEALEAATGLSLFGNPRRALVELCGREALAEDYLTGWVLSRDMKRYRVPSAVVRVVLEHWERIGFSNARRQAGQAEADEHKRARIALAHKEAENG
jgi:hypothetical protein